MHAALPELGSDIEIIETANPRTYYDLTRRKLGMVLGVEQNSATALTRTFLPNLFIVGDTISSIGNTRRHRLVCACLWRDQLCPERVTNNRMTAAIV